MLLTSVGLQLLAEKKTWATVGAVERALAQPVGELDSVLSHAMGLLSSNCSSSNAG